MRSVLESFSRFLPIALMLSTAFGTAAIAQDNDIEDCDDYCAEDCTGQGSDCQEAVGGTCVLAVSVLTCGSGEGPIRLKDHTDLDLDGNILECETGINCNDAILIEDSGSKVFNGNTNDEAIIRGKFLDGVDCDGQAGSEVSGIRIQSTFVGVRDCKKVENNVIVGVGRLGFYADNYGILSSGVDDNDKIAENYISGKWYGVRLTGDNDVLVQRNVINTDTYGGCIFNLTDSNSGAAFEDNVILGDGATLSGTPKIFCLTNPAPTGASYAGNICNETTTFCTDCQDDDHCMEFTAPFTPLP